MKKPVYLLNEISELNSTSTPLAAGATFTGVAAGTLDWSSVTIALKTDQDGILYVDFSTNGVDWDSILHYDVYAGINEVHRLTTTRAYVRIRMHNSSSAPQTYLRLQTMFGSHQALSAPFNLAVSQDADAIVAKTLSDELLIAGGLLSGYSIINKVGLNPDIDTATVPEDIWGNGGVYTGWATSAETLEVFSSSVNDASAGTGARTVRIMGLDANYNAISETVTLNGTTGVLTTQQFIRAHTMSTQSAGSGGVNAGTITVRQSTTTANVMLFMRIGLNQTNDGVYTVPAGYTAYLRNAQAVVRGSSNSIISAGIWARTFGGVFRQRRPLAVAGNSRYRDDIFGGLSFAEKTDITYRIDSSSANNAEVVIGFDLILVLN